MTLADRFLKPFLVLSGLGSLGVFSLALVLGQNAGQFRQMPGAPDLSDAGLVILLLVQPTILLLIAVALGVALAEKAGLASLVLRRLRGMEAAPASGRWGSTLLLAAVLASVVAAADLLFRDAFPAAFRGVPRLDEVTLAGRLVGLLYGGIAEELVMRFGLMTLLLWLGLRLTGGRGRLPLTWTAILIAALAFAAGHLGALAGSAGSHQDVLIVRTLALNGALGLLFGWLYARRNLEHAMLAHAASHVVFWTVTPLLVALGI
jgi:hypothetical protein